ncbi:MAG: hypothetical protein NUW00_04345 [Candidatus Kaiserbacteria bacterium]|nr:hypothetical protein [Candidatus Kaiserbacteria bacterium]
MHKRDALRSRITSPVMKDANLTKEDVGKVFVVNSQKTSARVMSHEEFLGLKLDEIGEWEIVAEFDIRP